MTFRYRTRQHVALPLLDVNQKPWRDLNTLIDRIGERAVLRALNIHEKTLYRWVTGRGQIPGRQHVAIQVLLGEIPGTEGQWSGWFFKAGKLWSPENVSYTAGQLRAAHFDADRISTLSREVTALRVKLAIAEQALDRFAPAANDRKRA
jgi:hypothetical protein